MNGEQRAFDDLAGLLADAQEDPEHVKGNIVVKRIFFAAVMYRPKAENLADLGKIAEVVGEGLEKIKSDFQNFITETEKMRKRKK